MEDTSPEIKQLVYRTIMERTEDERFIMCADMFEDAKEFAKVGMPEGLSETEQKAFVFERLYGNELVK